MHVVWFQLLQGLLQRGRGEKAVVTIRDPQQSVDRFAGMFGWAGGWRWTQIVFARG